mmetsp:Transcript_14979/g.24657  ORF Transcript_14979/g.24657 Transcript_14979/m.24657 type:complete len:336 (-) Transcript_14979:488-1495(-)
MEQTASARSRSIRKAPLPNFHPDPEDTGRIYVHSAELLKSLFDSVDEDDLEEQQDPVRAAKLVESKVLLAQNEKKLKEAQRARQEDRYREQIESQRKETERRLAEAAQQRDRMFQELFGHLLHEEATFVKEVGELISRKERLEDSKKQRLYEEWERKVFLPIQSMIQEQVDAKDYQDISRRRRDLFNDFLVACNTKKAGIFRDVLLPDYDPFRWNAKSIRIDTSKIEDPLKRDLLKIERERELRLDDRFSLEASKTKQMFDPTMWPKIEATPFYDRTERPVTQKKSTRTQSSIPFDHFTYPRGFESVKSEFPKGIKTFSGGKLKNPLPPIVTNPL